MALGYNYVTTDQYTDYELYNLIGLKAIAESLKVEAPEELNEFIGGYIPLDVSVEDLSTNKVVSLLIQAMSVADLEDSTLMTFNDDFNDKLSRVANSKIDEIAYVDTFGTMATPFSGSDRFSNIGGYDDEGQEFGFEDNGSGGGGKNSGGSSSNSGGGKNSGNDTSNSGGGKNSGQQDSSSNNGGGKNSGQNESSGGGKGSGDDDTYYDIGNCDCSTACDGFNLYGYCANECMCEGALVPEGGWPEDTWEGSDGGEWSFETSTIGQIFGGIGDAIQNAGNAIGWDNIWSSFFNTDDNGYSDDRPSGSGGGSDNEETNWGKIALYTLLGIGTIAGGLYLYRRYKK